MAMDSKGIDRGGRASEIKESDCGGLFAHRANSQKRAYMSHRTGFYFGCYKKAVSIHLATIAPLGFAPFHI